MKLEEIDGTMSKIQSKQDEQNIHGHFILTTLSTVISCSKNGIKSKGIHTKFSQYYINKHHASLEVSFVKGVQQDAGRASS